MFAKLFNLLVWGGTKVVDTTVNETVTSYVRSTPHRFFTPCCLGGCVFICAGSSTNTRNHERGHLKQYNNMGAIKFYLTVGVPSIFGNLWDRVFHRNWMTGDRERWYYSLPWEKEADELGGVKRWAN